MLFECYDAYGHKEYEVEAEIENFHFEPVMVEVEGKLYQSLTYRFEGNNTICKCTPVNVIRITTRGVGSGEISAQREQG